MSTSLMYRCLGIMGGGIPHVRTIFETGLTVFKIDLDPGRVFPVDKVS